MRAPLPHDAPLGLYIHIPFCARVCPYCDFNVYARQERLIPDYVEAVVREMDLLRERLGPVAVTTIYFGGGTPSLLPPESVARLVQAARERFAVEPDAEIDLEANPESAREDNLAGYREAGVNRLSIGAQTLRDRASELKIVNPSHIRRRHRRNRDRSGRHRFGGDLLSGSLRLDRCFDRWRWCRNDRLNRRRDCLNLRLRQFNASQHTIEMRPRRIDARTLSHWPLGHLWLRQRRHESLAE